MGLFEVERYRRGSNAVLEAVLKRTKEGATSLIGGGDTGNLVNMYPGAN